MRHCLAATSEDPAQALKAPYSASLECSSDKGIFQEVDVLALVSNDQLLSFGLDDFLLGYEHFLNLTNCPVKAFQVDEPRNEENQLLGSGVLPTLIPNKFMGYIVLPHQALMLNLVASARPETFAKSYFKSYCVGGVVLGNVYTFLKCLVSLRV